MLILSRKRGESIVIGDSIVVQVVEVSRGRVRLGIEAPQHVPVHRYEVFNALAREARAGQRPEPSSLLVAP